ncbi:integumentary mucin C.1-like [Malaya genurostris]|uniref:integumentary mucin C.1-like n=1 Tax=Malaya genurostris TaxID=325434 RepID=UPI0026F38252|nr:integumentary mucin C.1-like [Malaya genurostris]
MAFNEIMRNIGDTIMNNKLLTFLSVALFAFVIATIALASENNSNADSLAECKNRLWTATSEAPVTTTIAPVETSPTEGSSSSVSETISTTEQSSAMTTTLEETTTTVSSTTTTEVTTTPTITESSEKPVAYK